METRYYKFKTNPEANRHMKNEWVMSKTSHPHQHHAQWGEGEAMPKKREAPVHGGLKINKANNDAQRWRFWRGRYRYQPPRHCVWVSGESRDNPGTTCLNIHTTPAVGVRTHIHSVTVGCQERTCVDLSAFAKLLSQIHENMITNGLLSLLHTLIKFGFK